MHPVQPGDGRRPPTEQPQNFGDGQVELGQRQGQGRLQAEHPRRGLVEGPLLGVGGVGGVVGGDGVDGPVAQSLAHGVPVISRSQGRVHLEHRVVGGAGLVGEGEVMGGRLSGHRQPGLTGGPNHGDRAPGGQVLEVDRGAGEAAEGDVAHDHQLLGLGRHTGDAQAARPLPFVHGTPSGQRVHLAVLGQDHPQSGGVLHGPAHEPGILHAIAVIGEQAHAQRGHFGYGGQPVPLAAHSDGARGVHIARCRAAQRQHFLHHRGTVDGRVGVGHGHHRAEPAPHGGPAPRLDGLGLLGTGLAQMGVHVDQSGGHHAAGGVQRLITRQIGADGNDAVVVDHHIGHPLAGLIDHPPALDDGAHACSSPVSAGSAPSRR